MRWLVEGQIPWLALSALLGAVCTTLLMVRRGLVPTKSAEPALQAELEAPVVRRDAAPAEAVAESPWGVAARLAEAADQRKKQAPPAAPASEPEPVVAELPTFPDASARLEAERREAERLEAERLEAERAEAERAEAERAARLEAERAEAERVAAERAEAERAEAERAEAERVAAERVAAERVEAERLEAERAEAERVARLEAERAEAERVAAERVEAERLAAERAEAERLEAERVEAERLEAERVEAERLARLEAERVEAERVEAERLEAERVEAERVARLEAERAEAERVEAERLAAERAAAERAEAERAEATRFEGEPVSTVELAPAAFATLDELALLTDGTRYQDYVVSADDLSDDRRPEPASVSAGAPQPHEQAVANPPDARRGRLRRKGREEHGAASDVPMAASAADPVADTPGSTEIADLFAAYSPAVPSITEETEQPLSTAAQPVAQSEPAGAEITVFDSESHTPFGPGSLAPRLDGSAPSGYPVKGNLDTMLFHTSASRWFSRIRVDVWFESEEAAEAAGFTRWDRRTTSAHTLR